MVCAIAIAICWISWDVDVLTRMFDRIWRESGKWWKVRGRFGEFGVAP